MDINSAFPSNYLKAADLRGGRVTVAIDSVVIENIGDEDKPIVYFQGKEKGLVLNKTNANMVRDKRLIFAELKSAKGKVTPEQEQWLKSLSGVPGVEVYTLRPEDFDWFYERLK